MSKIKPYQITRTHEFDAGHRVYGHGGKCRHLHGHRYEVAFTVQANELNDLGMVIDFGVIKDKLCAWIDHHWDHKLLLWEEDPFYTATIRDDSQEDIIDSLVPLPFNPTAENMAYFLLTTVGHHQLKNSGVTLVKVKLNETRKCSATVELDYE